MLDGFAEGVTEYGGFKLRESSFPSFSVPSSGKTMRRTPNVLEAQELARDPLSSCQVWCCSDFIRRRGCQKRWVFCLSPCLSVVTLLKSFCARFRYEDGVQKRFWCRWIGEGCSCAPVFNFLRLPPIGNTTKCWSSNNRAKFGGFRRQRATE